MKIIRIKLLFIVIKFTVTMLPHFAYAINPSESCTLLPKVDDSGYLTDNTAFGFIQSNFYMKTHAAGACDAVGTEFKFCIKNKDGAEDFCKQVAIETGAQATLGSLTNNTDIVGKSFISNIVLSVSEIDEQLCLLMPTSRGPMPLICRDKTPAVPVEGEEGAAGEENMDPTGVCKTIAKSCYDTGNKSQSLFSFSGMTVQCLRDTLDKVFYQGSDCTPTEDNEIQMKMLRPFPEFQEAMKLTVRGMLILYIMFYGFKLVTNVENASLNKVATFLMKVILVMYFATGFWGGKTADGLQTRHNGMNDFVLPILVELTSNFTEFVFAAGGAQGLCEFDKSKYESGYEYYKIWDAVDCRIGYYLGMQLLYNIGSVLDPLSSSVGAGADAGTPINQQEKPSGAPSVLDSIGMFSMFALMSGFLMAGNVVIVLLGLMFVIVFVSVVLYFISAYIVCMIMLYVMAYISPIFIPLVLFERTKNYYDAWLKIVFSCALQPAVIGGAIAMLLTMYDTAIYGNCVYQRHDYIVSATNFSTFELMLPATDPELCTGSFGYKMLQYSMGQGWQERILLMFSTHAIDDALNLGASLLYMMLYVIVFYYFMKSINDFASELTGGPNLAAVTMSPNMVIDKTIGLAQASVSLAAAAVQLVAGNYVGAAKSAYDATKKALEDTSSNRKKGAEDNFTSENEEKAGDNKSEGMAGSVKAAFKAGGEK